MPDGTLFTVVRNSTQLDAQGKPVKAPTTSSRKRLAKINSSWSAMTRTGVGTEHTFSQLGECILDRDDVLPCDVLAQDARWPGSSL
jgi:hypothetical protein